MKISLLKNTKKNLHFIHIGKTGGSNIKSTLKDINLRKYKLIFHPHEVNLSDIPEGDKVFFCIRNPIDRFQSGFYSRKRKGQPRYYSEWSDSERISFNTFSSAEELASSLDENMDHYEEAKFAMNSITHINSSYWDWFKSEEYFNKRLSGMFFILRLENFNEDFNNLLLKLDIKKKIKLGSDKISMHSNNVKYSLSKESLVNLNIWYKNENRFIDFINKKINFINNK